MINGSNIICGEEVVGSGPIIESVNPSTGAVNLRSHSALEKEVSQAVCSARMAVGAWATQPLEYRESLLHKYRETLRTYSESLVDTICLEVGKPRWEAVTEVSSMVGKVDISIRAHRERCSPVSEGASKTRFKPHGVVAVFGPYNFPGHLPNGHIIPALLAGNTVVFKPSELASGPGELMVRAFHEAGLPPGVLNLVQGGPETGKILSAQGDLNGLFFTGSATVGLLLHRQFGTHPEKILALEMGGNNPLIVHRIDDLEAAVMTTLQSAYLTAGQRCTCARRLIIPSGTEGDLFLERLVKAIPRIRVGCPDDQPQPFMGPVISSGAAKKLIARQNEWALKGAHIPVPMRHLTENTGLVNPGLVDVTALPERKDDEWFGPLLQVIRVPDFDLAIEEANKTRFGLAAGLISDNRECYNRFYSRIRAGIVNWNQPLTGAFSSAPFGGVGLSGNFRPSAYFAADYCSYPVASIEHERMKLPAKLPPGLGM